MSIVSVVFVFLRGVLLNRAVAATESLALRQQLPQSSWTAFSVWTGRKTNRVFMRSLHGSLLGFVCDDEVDQRLALEETRPVVVPLAFGNDQLGVPAELAIPSGELS